MEGAGVVIAADLPALKEYDFRRAGSGDAGPNPAAPEAFGSTGWELEVVPGGDRRYLAVEYSVRDGQVRSGYVNAAELARRASRLRKE